VIVGIPLVIVIWTSLLRIGLGNIRDWTASPFAGWSNYARGLTGPNVLGVSALQSVWISIKFSLLATVACTPIALFAALSVYHEFRGRGLLRSVYLGPAAALHRARGHPGRARQLLAPAMVVSLVFAFLVGWNDVLFASALTNTQTQTVAITLQEFGQARGESVGAQPPYGDLMAAALVSAIPVVILYLGFQRYLVHGLAAGALSGT